MNAKYKQAKYVEWILKEVKNGNTVANDVYAKFNDEFELSRQSFMRYWVMANEKIIKTRERVEEAILENEVKKELRNEKTAEYYRNKILIKMEEILDQKPKEITGEILIPTYTDVIRAAERIVKMFGLDAAQKIEHDILTPVHIIIPDKIESDDI